MHAMTPLIGSNLILSPAQPLSMNIVMQLGMLVDLRRPADVLIQQAQARFNQATGSIDILGLRHQSHQLCGQRTAAEDSHAALGRHHDVVMPHQSIAASSAQWGFLYIPMAFAAQSRPDGRPTWRFTSRKSPEPKAHRRAGGRPPASPDFGAARASPWAAPGPTTATKTTTTTTSTTTTAIESGRARFHGGHRPRQRRLAPRRRAQLRRALHICKPSREGSRETLRVRITGAVVPPA